ANWTPEEVIGRLAIFTAIALSLVGGWTLALPVLRLRGSRPPLRRLLRQPGMTACIGALAGMAWGAVVWGGTLSMAWTMQGRLRLPLIVWIRVFSIDELLPCVGLSVGG